MCLHCFCCPSATMHKFAFLWKLGKNKNRTECKCIYGICDSSNTNSHDFAISANALHAYTETHCWIPSFNPSHIWSLQIGVWVWVWIQLRLIGQKLPVQTRAQIRATIKVAQADNTDFWRPTPFSQFEFKRYSEVTICPDKLTRVN